MNPYKVLEVKPGASLDEVRKSYRRLAKIHHPDKAGGSQAKFLEINEAWETLKTQLESADKLKKVLKRGVITHKTLFTFRRI